MKHCFIVPEAYINPIGMNSDMHLVLAHEILKRKTYTARYRALKKSKKHFIILDNGAFELGKPLPTKKLIEAAKIVNADEIVAPDIRGNLSATLKAVKRFIMFLRIYHEKKFSVAGVVQGSSLDECIKCIAEYQINPNISTVCIPMIDPISDIHSWIKDKNTRIIQNRLYLLKGMSRMFAPKPVHLLGLRNPIELTLAKQFDFVRSNDSSSAFIHGMNLRLFDNKYGLIGDKEKKLLDFDIDNLTSQQRGAIEINVQQILSYIGDDNA